MRLVRLHVVFLAFLLLLSPLSPTLQICLAADQATATAGSTGTGSLTAKAPSADGAPVPVETTGDFVDKWILNGNAIGGAIGATAGQWIGTVLAPGPVGWVVGSLIGGLVGGVIGNLIDNQINNAYNYAAFDRPPIEDGGLWIEGAGTWEQALYQTDLWVVSGGGIASLVAHFGINLFSAFIPGPMGKFLQSYLGIFVFDALFGTIGDNVDGLVDGGKIGARIDKALGTEGEDPESEAGARAPRSPFTAAALDPDKARKRREAYETYMDLVAAGQENSPRGMAAYERYRALTR